MNDAVLVTGAGGFIGRAVAEALVSSGRRVLAVSRRPVAFEHAHIEAIVNDLRDESTLVPLLGRCAAVVHTASTSTPASSAGRPVEELGGNLAPTLTLLQALQQSSGVNLLYLSSGGSLYASDPVPSVPGRSLVAPRSYHGAAKVAAEVFIAAWCSQYDRAATILRPSNIYGPGQVARPGFGIVPTAFAKLLSGEELRVWGDGNAVRDYLFIDDLARLCVDTIGTPMPIGTQTLNVGSGVGVTLRELLVAMEGVSGRQLNCRYGPSRTVDADCVVMDSSDARYRYGWEPRVSLMDGLERTWAWFTTTRA